MQGQSPVIKTLASSSVFFMFRNVVRVDGSPVLMDKWLISMQYQAQERHLLKNG